MLTIDENGVLRINEPGRHIVLAPGDFDAAQEVLTPEELAQVEAAWTPAVIDAWQQAHPDYEPPVLPGPELPSVEARVAAVEDAVIELALGGLL